MLLDFSAWWDSMALFEKIYWTFAIPSTLIFLVIMVMTFVGGDMDADGGDVDADIDSDGGMGFQFFTIKNLIGFFTIFSWSGLACIDTGMGTMSTILISVSCGLLMMVLMASLFYFMGKLSDSGTLNMNNSIGKLGEVYLTIPAKKGGFGKVQINVQGSLRELKAMTDEDSDLGQGTVIQVMDVIDQHILLVKKSS